MVDGTILGEWLSLALRWLHVITGIAWIGSSFYFVALDLGLRKAADQPPGVGGEAWQVHGGGFYHIRKYVVAPEALPDHLTWFKWEAYATWLTGMALMGVVYYAGAELYLIDPTVRDLPAAWAIAASLTSLGLGWAVYHLLCRSRLGASDAGLMAALSVVLVAAAWGYAQLFSGRAALLHLGAFTATVMSANVFFVIIPNQKRVVADLIAGRAPDPELGRQAKQRSTHNNYLTLPVLFLMLSNHYPLAFAGRWNWLIAVLTFPIGALIRHYFNARHAGTGNPLWTWPAAAALFAVIVWLSAWPPAAPAATATGEAAGFAAVREAVLARCSMCHAAEPVWEGIAVAPKWVRLESDDDIVRHARDIYLQAGRSRAMPPGNLTEISADERRAIVEWYEGRVR